MEEAVAAAVAVEAVAAAVAVEAVEEAVVKQVTGRRRVASAAKLTWWVPMRRGSGNLGRRGSGSRGLEPTA